MNSVEHCCSRHLKGAAFGGTARAMLPEYERGNMLAAGGTGIVGVVVVVLIVLVIIYFVRRA
jgi:hypothetical protein